VPRPTVEQADHRSLKIARAIPGLQMLAYAQEAALLGVPSLPPQQLTVEQLQASDESFTAAYLSSTLVGAVGVIDKPASVRVSTGAGNEPALALYRKHGFFEYKRWFVGPQRLALAALKLERASAAK
jgi:hypothetical protein